jgi:hypothetical protein
VRRPGGKAQRPAPPRPVGPLRKGLRGQHNTRDTSQRPRYRPGASLRDRLEQRTYRVDLAVDQRLYPLTYAAHRAGVRRASTGSVAGLTSSGIKGWCPRGVPRDLNPHVSEGGLEHSDAGNLPDTGNFPWGQHSGLTPARQAFTSCGAAPAGRGPFPFLTAARMRSRTPRVESPFPSLPCPGRPDWLHLGGWMTPVPRGPDARHFRPRRASGQARRRQSRSALSAGTGAGEISIWAACVQAV